MPLISRSVSLRPSAAYVDLRQEADHVVLRLPAFRLHLIVHVLLEAVEQLELLDGLLLRQQVAVTAPVHERLHLRGAPLREARNVLAREAEHVRHHPLRQRPREFRDELHLAAIDPRVDEFVHAARDHFRVAAGAGPDPRIGQFLPMRAPEFDRWAQRQHRGDHRIRLRQLLRRQAGLLQLIHRQRQRRRKSHRVAHDGRDVGVLRQDESVACPASDLRPADATPALRDAGSRTPRTSVPARPAKTGRRLPGAPGNASRSARGSVSSCS